MINSSAIRYSITSAKKGGSEGEEAHAELLRDKPSENNSNEEQKTLNDLNGRHTTKRATKGSPQWSSKNPKTDLTSFTDTEDRGISKNEVGDRSVISNVMDTSDQDSSVESEVHSMEWSHERTVDGNELPRKVAENLPLEREGNLDVYNEVNANKDLSMQGIQYKNPGKVSYEDIYNLDNLKAGYAKLKTNVAAGIDGRTKSDLTEKGLMKLSKQLRKQTYKPKPAKRIMIPKPDGGLRPLSMACAVDKVVQSTLKLLIEPQVEPRFRESSHGFRPGKSCHTALREIRLKWTSMTWLIPIDIKKYFDKIHHDLLLEVMGPVLPTRSLQDLINKLLKAGYVDVYNLSDRTKYNLEGVPQGSIISPLCANMFLHQLDCFVEDELIPRYTEGDMRPMRKEYNQRGKMSNMDKEILKEYPELINAIQNIKHRRWIESNEPSRVTDYDGYKRVKYIRYADDILIGVVGSLALAKEIRAAIQEFLKEKLFLEIHDSPIIHAKTDQAHFIGTHIIYRDKSKIITEDVDKISNIKRIKLQPITRAQLYIPIQALLKRARDRGYAKENAQGLLRATAHSSLSASEDRHIVNHYSAVIRGLVNFYSFANKRSSLWKVISIYRKSCALTLAKKHKIRSAVGAFNKFGPNLRITEKGKPVASLEYPDSLKTIGKFNIRSRSSDLAILEEPFDGKVWVKRTDPEQLKEKCELCGSDESLELHHLRPVQ
uniref:Reverse transcriptase domain-containing protein n=1 Tax=Ostreobium quekettii TaxID=121088 RepID=A0A650BYA3_9CHLO|nr:hypothetical protein [Ostreobium quekettii]QGQ61981.1 hypothetical protein [Ostreobium quekettii]